MELRCTSRIHGILDDQRLEVKCRSKKCGASKEELVFHYFNITTGELIETKKYKEPSVLFEKEKEG